MKHETPEEQFGARVREAREHRGWTQDALARHLRESAAVDLHQTAIARLERGERAIRFNEAAGLAKVLNIDLRPFTGSAVEPLLTQEDYERVKKLADEAREVEMDLAKSILTHRHEMERAVADLEANRIAAAGARWKMEMAIAEYEENQRRGEH